MDITQILITPVVTEKSSKAQAGRKYTFLVHQDAHKVAIKQAVEKAYGIDVESVNIIPVRSKIRLAGKRTITKRSTGRKAVVTVAKKQTIDFNKIKVS